VASRSHWGRGCRASAIRSVRGTIGRVCGDGSLSRRSSCTMWRRAHPAPVNSRYAER